MLTRARVILLLSVVLLAYSQAAEISFYKVVKPLEQEKDQNQAMAISLAKIASGNYVVSLANNIEKTSTYNFYTTNKGILVFLNKANVEFVETISITDNYLSNAGIQNTKAQLLATIKNPNIVKEFSSFLEEVTTESIQTNKQVMILISKNVEVLKKKHGKKD